MSTTPRSLVAWGICTSRAERAHTLAVSPERPRAVMGALRRDSCAQLSEPSAQGRLKLGQHVILAGTTGTAATNVVTRRDAPGDPGNL